MPNQIVCLLIILLFSRCQSSGQNQTKGQVLVTSYYYGKESAKVRDSIAVRIWWNGTQSIQQVPLVRFEEDSAGNRKEWVEIKHYSFLDSKRNVCYNYTHFADTAKVLKTYSNIDSVVAEGGWNFSKGSLPFDTAFRQMDTTINGEKFQRLFATRSEGINSIDFIMYMKCGIRTDNVKLYKNLSDSLGCDILRIDAYVNNKIVTSRRIISVSDKLTEEELNVFETWEKNVIKTRENNH